jgi:hypothetical protein
VQVVLMNVSLALQSKVMSNLVGVGDGGARACHFPPWEHCRGASIHSITCGLFLQVKT